MILVDILATKKKKKKKKGSAIKEICTFKLEITYGQCCVVICGCGMNKRFCCLGD